MPNLVVVKVGADGAIDLFNAFGTTDVVVDVTGWFPVYGFGGVRGGVAGAVVGHALGWGDGGRGPGGGGGSGRGTRRLPVVGRGGVPAAGVGAVVVNVTVAGASAAGYVTVFPSGEVRPLASNLNYTAGETVPNLVVVKVGADGAIDLFNAFGTTDVVVDVTGWFPVSGSAGFVGVSPARLLDTRSGGVTVDGAQEAGGGFGSGERGGCRWWVVVGCRRLVWGRWW